MDTTLLRVFASKARSSKRLLYGDLRWLRRDVLRTDVKSREEVETVLTLDSVERVDDGWRDISAIGQTVHIHRARVTATRFLADCQHGSDAMLALSDKMSAQFPGQWPYLSLK